MYNLDSIKNLPIPNILELPTFAEIKEQNIALLQELTDRNYIPLEDDDVLLIVEAFAYRELHLRAIVNLKIKQMMPHYANDEDLDNFIFGFYGGITRLQGAYPYVDVKFAYEEDGVLTLPEGTIVTNANGDKGRLMRSLSFSDSSTEAVERVELLELVERSEVELTEVFDFPKLKVLQLGTFDNGATKESDERFLERALLSLNRPSTAGAIGSYYYHIMNADVRVDTAYCYSPSAGVVRIVLDNFDAKIDELSVAKIEEVLNRDDIKPLTDSIEVKRANQIELTLEVEATLYDLMTQRDVDDAIKANFVAPFKINEDLTYSDLIQRLHVDGVYSVRCLNISSDVEVDALSRLIIKGVNCVYIQR